MIVFKTFLKVLNKNKFVLILYTVFLVVFGTINMQTSEASTSFQSTEPDIFIMNHDENKGITNHLIQYLEEQCHIEDIQDNDQAIQDALFYRDISYIIIIPEHFREDFLNGKQPQIEVKSTGDYEASYAQMLLSRYMKVAHIYQQTYQDEDDVIEHIHETLKQEVSVEVSSHLDTNQLSNASFFYNFMNYSLLAGTVYMICLMFSSFKEEKIYKRITVSSMDYKKHNRILLMSNGLLALTLWLLYIVLSFILVGKVMFTIHGLIYILNAFIFTICTLTLAFFIANIVGNKNAINGIVNVVALGSSFLCGAFVPVELLPDIVLKIAHILPSYWYIQTNELLKTMEIVNFTTLQPVLIHFAVICAFSIMFIVLTNLISKRKQRL